MNRLKAAFAIVLGVTICQPLQAQQQGFAVREVKGATAASVRAWLPKGFKSLKLIAFTLNAQNQNVLLHFYSSPNFGKPLSPERHDRNVPYYFVSVFKRIGKGRQAEWKRINKIQLPETDITSLEASENFKTIYIDGFWLNSKRQQVPIIRLRLVTMAFYSFMTKYWLITFANGLPNPPSISEFMEVNSRNETGFVRFHRDEQGYLVIESGWVENLRDPEYAGRPAKSETYKYCWDGKKFESKAMNQKRGISEPR